MKQLKFVLLLIIIAATTQAQIKVKSSPFKHLPIPSKNVSLFGATLPTTSYITAWRFTGPMAGTQYLFNSNTFQVLTGLGYGYQKMHFVDSTQKYYTDFSANFVMYAGGNATPSLYPNNVISVGLSIGLLNQLIMFGPSYNLPKNGNGGSLGVVFNISVPLN